MSDSAVLAYRESRKQACETPQDTDYGRPVNCRSLAVAGSFVRRFKIGSAIVVVTCAVASANVATAQRVTGGTQVTIDNSTWLLSFSASQDVDGTVTGQAQHWRQNDNELVFISHLNLDCMHVLEEENAVILGGTATQDSDPDFVGSTVVFAVRDNGKGPKAPADEVTGVQYSVDLGLELDCDVAVELLDLGFFDLEAGLDPIQHGNVRYDANGGIGLSQAGGTLNAITVPEPTAAILGLFGLPMIGALRRRRYRR